MKRLGVVPTPFGIASLGLIALGFFAPTVTADPAIVGLVWCATLGFVVMGWVWPIIAIRLVEVECLANPTDSTAGRSVELIVRLRRRLLLNALHLEVADQTAQPVPLEGTGPILVTTAHRSVVDALPITLTTDAPLGMVRAKRTGELTLRRPIAIGPDPVPRRVNVPMTPESGVEPSVSPVSGGGDVVRTVRPYRPGDPAHLVHWPSSARTGSLVVRELEPPLRHGMVIVIELRSRSEAVERAVAEAAGLALAALRTGASVVLCTCERGRPVVGEVHSPLSVSRRLAAASVGEPGRPPAGTNGSAWTVVTVAP